MAWIRDHDCYLLWRELEREARRRGGPEYLPEGQRRFLEASRASQKDRHAAGLEFQKLADDLAGASNGTDEQQEVLEAARHRAARYLNADSGHLTSDSLNNAK